MGAAINGFTFFPAESAVCPICREHCGHGRSNSLIICRRTSAGAIKELVVGEPPLVGYLHRIDQEPKNGVNFPKMHQRCVEDLTDAKAEEFGEMQNVPLKVIRDFGFGWSAWAACYTLPLRNAQWGIVGRMMLRDGKTAYEPNQAQHSAVIGPVRPDFIYNPFADQGPVTIVSSRGIRNVLAAHAAGYVSIGRPSASFQAKELAALAKRHDLEIVIIPDQEGGWVNGAADGKRHLLGWEGAMRLAADLWESRAFEAHPNRLRFAEFAAYPSIAAMLADTHAGTEAIAKVISMAQTVSDKWLEFIYTRYEKAQASADSAEI